MQAKYNL